MKFALASLLISALHAVPAFAEAPPTKVSCLVYNSVTGAPVAKVDGEVSLQNTQTVFQKGSLEYTMGRTEAHLPDGSVVLMLILAINKNGETLAQSFTDIDPAKLLNVSLSSSQKIPAMACSIAVAQ